MAAGDITAVRSKASDVFSAASFDGVDDYVGESVQYTSTRNFSYSLWFNLPVEVTNDECLFSTRYLNPHLVQHALSFETSGGSFVAKFQVYKGAAYDKKVSCTTLTSSILRKWNHICGVCDDSNIYIYLNGVLENTTSLAGVVPSVDLYGYTIGNFDNIGGLSRYVMAFIKDVKVFNVALSQTEVTELFSGKDILRNKLLREWKLENNYLDTSGHGANGTNTGTFLTNTFSNKIKADMQGMNLAAATDKIIVVQRKGSPVIIKAERAAA